ncbi:MAG: cupin domain-containing protein [Methanomicrobiaceae archaeon]|uniref:Mannose-6-phosphate isomerase n=1 Tax=hydrocarbon metagenome TaxID=938273 RepID=A0A0W8FHN4_9ZZZZ|nr:cupin domain-containing protein [Methanomicrobiaceae archaeon]
MLIRDIRDGVYEKVMDGSILCELLHPDREREEIPMQCSIAHAIVPAGASTLPHRLRDSSEVYYILMGEGRMHIDRESAPVRPGQAVFIPPRASQHIENTGEGDLTFLCIVDPRWRAEDEELA